MSPCHPGEITLGNFVARVQQREFQNEANISKYKEESQCFFVNDSKQLHRWKAFAYGRTYVELLYLRDVLQWLYKFLNEEVFRQNVILDPN